MQTKAPELYRKFFIEKCDERLMLFEKLVELCRPQRGIYPGSFVHITPSFFIRDMTYIDSDKRIQKFFNDESLIAYIEERKTYKDKPLVHGCQADYGEELPIERESFDMMFSFYAGFISQTCKKYLANGGILICNNSHGDATLAFTDNDYELKGVIKRNNSKFTITENDLGTYFIKKDGTPIDRSKVLSKMVGENFTRKGFAYIFKLIRGLPPQRKD